MNSITLFDRKKGQMDMEEGKMYKERESAQECVRSGKILSTGVSGKLQEGFEFRKMTSAIKLIKKKEGMRVILNGKCWGKENEGGDAKYIELPSFFSSLWTVKPTF